jgi:hypothetical protein
VFLFPKRRTAMNIKEWKKRLAEILKEHSDIGEDMTGKIEVNMNNGGVSKIYTNKELK